MIDLDKICLQNKNILISGASGFIGFNFSKYVLDRSNIKIYAYRDKVINIENNSRIKELNKHKNFYIVNSRDVNDITEPISVVINFASFGVDSRQKDIDNLLDGNIVFAIKLTDIAKKFNAKFIHTATCYEYKDTPHDILESEALSPDSLYGAFKAASSIILKEVCKSKKVDYIILRLFGVYGPNETGEKLFPYLYQKLSSGSLVELTQGNQIRDYTYITDVVKAYLLVCFNDNKYCEYNVCSSNGISIKDFIIKFSRSNNYDESLLCFGMKNIIENGYMRVVGDNRRISNEYKWKPDVSHNTGLKLINDDFLGRKNINAQTN